MEYLIKKSGLLLKRRPPDLSRYQCRLYDIEYAIGISCGEKKISETWPQKLTAEIFLYGCGFAGGATLNSIEHTFVV